MCPPIEHAKPGPGRTGAWRFSHQLFPRLIHRSWGKPGVSAGSFASHEAGSRAWPQASAGTAVQPGRAGLVCVQPRKVGVPAQAGWQSWHPVPGLAARANGAGQALQNLPAAVERHAWPGRAARCPPGTGHDQCHVHGKALQATRSRTAAQQRRPCLLIVVNARAAWRLDTARRRGRDFACHDLAGVAAMRPFLRVQVSRLLAVRL